MTTTLSKRSFVLGAASAAATPLAWAQGASAPTEPVLPALGATPGAHHWQAYLHQAFTLQADGVSHTVVLSRVAPAANGSGLQQFVLGFETLGGVAVPAGTHQLQHANGQTTQVFLGDAGRRGAQQRLRAEFCLLTTAA
jgi:hypothetical protein